MNEDQSAIFSKLLDINWKIRLKKDELSKMESEMVQIDTELRESMGMEAYMKFMNNGKKMFAPNEG